MAPMKPPARASSTQAETGSVRIIGGRWRNTRLAVPASPGLRPSSDRVSETLINWQLQVLPGARVIDVFAGTGVLGLEAVSRGAAHALLLERNAALVQSLRGVVQRLSAQDAVEVVHADALAWLARYAGDGFDLAFVDPPFDGDLWQMTLAALLPRLAPGAWLYLESPHDKVPVLPAGWALHREGRTREVRFALYRAPARRGADTLDGNVSVAVPE